MIPNFKTINPADIKPNDYVMCTQKNGNQFIGCVREIDHTKDHIRFTFTLLDNGEKTGNVKGKISDFEYINVNDLREIINLLKMTSDTIDKEESVETKSENVMPTDTVEFNEEQWLANKYPLVTRDGDSVRIIDVTVKGKYHILALLDKNGEEMPVCYNSHGYAGIGNDPNCPRFRGLDLLMVVEKPKPVTRYAYVYKRDNTGTTFLGPIMYSIEGLKNLNTPAGCSIIATIPVEY
jgi:hypothetical protein